MNNYGFGFGSQFGGGGQLPWGAAGAGQFMPAQQGMGRPQFQRMPYIPGPRQFPQLPPGYRRDLPSLRTQQSTLTPTRPIAPPVSRGIGGGLGGTAAGQAGGSGQLNQQYIRRELNRPDFQPGFMSVPPEQTPVQPTYQSRMPQIPTQPPVSGPPRQLTPSESAQLRSMDQQMQNFQYRDQNLPRYQSAVDDINRQTDSMERTQLPDVNSPNFQPITPQQAFMQIPGNYLSGYQDRFNRIKANQPPTEPPMTASQATSTMPNYADRLAQVNPELAANAGVNPTYMADNRITPTPRAGTLTPAQVAQMQAVGSSVGDWRNKANWMIEKGYQGEMTPQQAQAYTAEQQQKRLAANDAAFARKMTGLNRAGMVRDYLANAKGQRFRIENPALFQTPDFTSAQLTSSLAGGSLQQFQQPGLTPAQAMQAQLQNQQNQVQLIQQEPDPEKKAAMIEAYQRGQSIGGTGGWAGSSTNAASADSYNRDETGKLSQGRIAGKIANILRNPKASPDDLIREGINQYTLAELESNLSGGFFGTAESEAMKDLIIRARQVLSQKPNQPPGNSQSQPALVPQVPTTPPVQKVYNPQYPASY